VAEGQVDEFTADDLSRELIFVMAQLGAAAKRGVAIRRQKIRVAL